ncbi:MAG: triacylglycerol lipase [Acidipropionibacterium acidipropionici]|uniref:lipase family alpha/beta hydrolase n=1 Tax=Acidipropionibacterium acidipropionici TaxID=1748 RepID=UPI002F360CD5
MKSHPKSSARPLAVLAGALASLVLAVSAAPNAMAATEPTLSDPGGVAAPHSPAGVPSAGQGLMLTTWPAAAGYAAKHPGTNPVGANNFSCRPTKGTHPVVLVPGTNEDAFATWAYYAPKLRAKGLCVYSFNYNPLVVDKDKKILAESATFAGDMKSSAAFMAGFVDKVLASTGAEKVDLIGHSQGGGPLPRAYIKYFGGASKVNHLVGLVPSNKGTTVFGITNALRDAEQAGLINGIDTGDAPALIDSAQLLKDHNWEAMTQQVEGSPFITALNDGGMTAKGVKYTVIATKYDDVVTPYTNSFLDDASADTTNIVIQNKCALDHTDHFGAAFDPVAFQVAFNSLYPDRASHVTCRYVAPVIH